MVKYGRHLLFLSQRLPKDAYLVNYKGVQSTIGDDPEPFVRAWEEALHAATDAHDRAMSDLWSEVLSQVYNKFGADGGVKPVVALRMYLEAMGARETQRLIDKYNELRTTCLANWEALRKLVKKFDKNNGTAYCKDFVENEVAESATAKKAARK